MHDRAEFIPATQRFGLLQPLLHYAIVAVGSLLIVDNEIKAIKTTRG
jgi:hypothetical protein